jgi:hypothetical protein
MPLSKPHLSFPSTLSIPMHSSNLTSIVHASHFNPSRLLDRPSAKCPDQPSSRTLVMPFSAPLELWVFSSAPLNMDHEPAVSLHHLAFPLPHSCARRPHALACGPSLRRRARPPESHSDRRLLLPLPRSVHAPRLHQNVRRQKKRSPMARHHLHEAALPVAER